jgi:hypothetical protein
MCHQACLLADPALVYGFTKPFDNYFKEYVDKRSMAAVSKFLTQQVRGCLRQRNLK